MGFRDAVFQNCSGCKRHKLIVHKYLNLCLYCNNKRKNFLKRDDKKKTQTKQRKAIPLRSERGRRIAQEDNSFFRGIWDERPHVSEVSGEPLGDKFKAVFMSHVLSKGAFPRFRHYKPNIVLMSFDEHDAWGNSHKQNSEEFKRKFANVLELKERLKREYYLR